MGKKEILFVVGGFYQAGAERFMYEVDKALNKIEFNSTILCLERENQIDPNWKVRYFEEKHKALGSTIIYVDSFLNNENKTLIQRVFDKITRYKFKKPKAKFKSNLNKYIESYDVVHWMGEYTFIHEIPSSIKNKSLIQPMSAKFQNKNLYSSYDFDYPYNFMSGFIDSEKDYEFSEFKKIQYYFFPLAMDLSTVKKTWKFEHADVKKIGIFTRLNQYKPLDPFFYSFQLLLEKIPNVELHIFGNGDPEKTGMNNILKRLDIQDKVYFRGHQSSIAEAVSKEHLDLSWFQGYKNERPAGYAGFELCATGLPLICWDFFENSPATLNEVYPHYKNMTQFVAKSVEIILDKKKAKELSDRQFSDVLENRDIQKYIKDLENVYAIICENE